MNRTPRRSATEWSDIVAQFYASGKEDHEFCQQHQLNLSSFRKWKYRYPPSPAPAQSPPAPSGGFIEVLPRPVDSSEPIRIQLSEGVSLECPAALGVDSIVRLLEALRDGR